jgi:hypothetical protein
VAVCILPGTELAFEQPVTYQTTLMFRANTGHTVAIFRLINRRATSIMTRSVPQWRDCAADAAP